MFENPMRGRQARNFTKNVPEILDLKSSSEQIFSENWCWVSLKGQCLSKFFHFYLRTVVSSNILNLILSENLFPSWKRVSINLYLVVYFTTVSWLFAP